MPFGAGLSISDRVFYAFSQPPASFAFDGHNRTRAVSRGQAVIQILNDTTAVLVCIGSTDEAANKHNAWLLCYLLAITGWEQGSEAWLAARFKEAARTKEMLVRSMVVGGVRYDLRIAAGMITLRVEQTT